MSEYLTVRQLSQRHKAFSESSLRYHIFHEKQNGLSSAIRRVGRKILIREDGFLAWLEGQNGGVA
jgi:hypothetical protein